MSDAQMYAGVAQGLSNVAQYQRERPQREARVAEAKNRQQLSEMKLQEYVQGAPRREAKADIELEQMQGELRKERAARLKTDTYQAFDRYEGDGDARHLNNFLNTAKTNPMGRETYGKWARWDVLQRNPETEAMLGQAGITDVDAYFEDPELVKSKVLATDTNGQQTLLDLNKLQQMSGYSRFADQRTRATLMERAKLEDMMRGTESAETRIIAKIAKEEGLTTAEAAKVYYDAKGSSKTTGSTIERTARELRRDNPDLSYAQALRQASRTIASPSGSEKDVGFTREVRQQVHEAAGGDFYEADLADPKVRRKVGERITALEQASKSQLSTEDKRLARDYRALAGLGGKVGDELTEEQTGIIDNMLHEFKQYFSDNVEGTEATAAYNTFRNFARNALMGATLTPAEIKSYNQAAGTLKQQLGPVLAKFKVQMESVRTKLQSIYDMNDPMIAEYYLGAGQEELDTTIEGLDRRIDLLNTKSSAEAEDIKIDMRTTPKKVVLAQPDTTVPNNGIPASEFWNSLGAKQ